MTEVLDVKNIFEIQRIRTIIRGVPELLLMFDEILEVANIRLNSQAGVKEKKEIIEEYIEPDLSSDSEDDLLLED